jgi:hypothetical protein
VNIITWVRSPRPSTGIYRGIDRALPIMIFAISVTSGDGSNYDNTSQNRKKIFITNYAHYNNTFVFDTFPIALGSWGIKV